MTRAQAKIAVRKYYNLKRPVTDKELDAEVANIRRKKKAGMIDDFSGHLYAALYPYMEKENPCNYKTLLKNPSRRYTAKQLSEIRKNFATIKSIDPESKTYNDLIVLLDEMPQVQLKQLAAAKINFLSGLARNRVKRKGNPTMAKKKRSAKQLANDRRLGRMAKARAKAKRGGRRKKVASKNPHRKIRVSGTKRQIKRPALKKSHLWFIFACRGKTVKFLIFPRLVAYGWTPHRNRGVLYKVKNDAHKMTRIIAAKEKGWQVGVASDDTTSAKIIAACNAGKV